MHGTMLFVLLKQYGTAVRSFHSKLHIFCSLQVQLASVDFACFAVQNSSAEFIRTVMYETRD
jgi:hypothetical protein